MSKPKKERGTCATCGRSISIGANLCAAHARSGHTPEQRDGHTLCGAKKRDGSTCRAFAGQGTEHPGIGACKFHAGSTSAAGKHAITLEAKQRMVTLGAPLDEAEARPQLVLLNLLRATAGHVAWLYAEIAQLDDLGSRHAEVLISMYDSERDRAARIAKACSEAGVEEAQIRLAQRETTLVVQFMEAVFGEIRLTEGQRAAAGPAMRKHLGLLDGTHALDSSQDDRITKALEQDGPPVEWSVGPAAA